MKTDATVAGGDTATATGAVAPAQMDRAAVVTGMAEALGEKPEVSHTPWGAWMATGPQWQSLDGAGLAWLADGLKWIGDGAKAERARLATYVTKDRLASAAAIRTVAPKI